jgi:hypothetical protein
MTKIQNSKRFGLWSPTGRARGPSISYPPTPLGAEALRCASAKASEGYPPMAKSAEAAILRCVKYLEAFCAFIHGHSPRSSAQADKIYVIEKLRFRICFGFRD